MRRKASVKVFTWHNATFPWGTAIANLINTKHFLNTQVGYRYRVQIITSKNQTNDCLSLLYITLRDYWAAEYFF